MGKNLIALIALLALVIIHNKYIIINLSLCNENKIWNYKYKRLLYLNCMSYQYKKSTILYELEQAIKKKVIEKSKHKEPSGKVLQSSIEKKKINRQCYDRQSSKSKDSLTI